MKELIENDRIVGGVNNESTKVASKFYKQFVKGEILEPMIELRSLPS